MTSAEQVKDFYNTIFFNKEGKSAAAVISIAIQHEDKILILPKMEVFPENNLDEIFKTIHTELKKTGPVEIPFFGLRKEPEAISSAVPLITEIITFRNTHYQVEEFKDERFVIKRRNTMSEIPEKSPVYNSVLKKYKDAAKQSSDN